ncbi:MAG: hypothetical protein AB1486_25885 [Planctomycetota bacterium]
MPAENPFFMLEKTQLLLKVGFALVVVILLLRSRYGRSASSAREGRGLRRPLCWSAGALGALLWLAEPVLGLSSWQHLWDTYHYYVGAKYFAELGYDGLYDAAILADAENGHAAEVRELVVRDLRSNELKTAEAAIVDAAHLRERFSEERWRGFLRDIAYFRGRFERQPGQLWGRVHQDHGFNATPTWCLAGGFLARTGGASDARLALLCGIDFVLLAIAGYLIGRTFGGEVLLVAAAYWGTNQFNPYPWTSASLLRYDWLLMAVAGICLLKRQQHLAGGAALAVASLLRLFPVLLLVAVAVREALRMWAVRSLRPSRDFVRFSFGALLLIALLLPLSTWASGRGSRVWREFQENCRLHLQTPSMNTVGLVSLLSTQGRDVWKELPATVEGRERERLWTRARETNYASWRWLHWAAGALLTLLVLRATRDQPPWAAAILGVGLIPVVADLSCYYYAILLLFAMLVAAGRAIAVMLCGLAAATSLVVACVEYSEATYGLMSGGLLVFLALVLWVCRRSADAEAQSIVI